VVEDEFQHLRVPIANEKRERLELLAQVESLQGAFGRRALIEQAKGILMARHSIDAEATTAER